MVPTRTRCCSALALVVASPFVRCDGTHPTPVGTALVEMASVDVLGLGPLVGPSAKFDRTYAFHDHGPAIDAVGSPAFRVTFEYGPAALSGDASAGTNAAGALRNLRIAVARNERWAMSAHCDPPMLRGEEPPADGRATWIQCPVTIARQNGGVTFTSWVQITASPSVSASRELNWDVQLQ